MHPTNFYSRQLALKEVGEQGQRKLKNTHLALIGAGGLGHPAAQYLAAAGVGKMTIIDDDKVEESNLNRQVLFHDSNLGESKSITLQQKIMKQNPLIEVNAIHGRLDRNNIEELISDTHIIMDCTDNFETKFLLHDFAFEKNINLVQASIHQFEGQIRSFNYAKEDVNKGCLRCLWEETPHQSCVDNCQQAGLIGATAGVFGTLQAMEALKLILDLGAEENERQTFFFNLLNLDSFSLHWKKNDFCPLCSLKTHSWREELKSISSSFEVDQIPDDYLTIDLTRNNLSHEEIDQWEEFVCPDQKYIFVCQKGLRSYRLVSSLTQRNIKNCFSLKGGWERLEIHD